MGLISETVPADPVARPLDRLLGALDETVPKEYLLGTHRTCSPAQTIERVRPHLAAMGITRIADVTGLDTIGIPVVMVCRPLSRSGIVSQGKGVDRDAAVASGLMESIESYHAERPEGRAWTTTNQSNRPPGLSACANSCGSSFPFSPPTRTARDHDVHDPRDPPA